MRFNHLSMDMFKKTLLSYLLILLLPLMIGSFLYRRSVAVVEQQAVDLSLTAQSNAIISIDNYLRQMEELALQFYLDKDITALQDVDPVKLETSDMSKLLKAQKKFSSHYISPEFTDEYFLFFTKSNVIFSPYWVTANPELYYDKTTRYETMTYEEWRSYLNQVNTKDVIPMQQIQSHNNSTQAFTYLIPIRFRENSYAVLSVLFKEELIEQIFGIQQNINQYIYILDSQNKLIYNSSADSTPLSVIDQLSGSSGYFTAPFQGESSLFVHSTSPYNDWVYLSVVPSQVLLQPVHQIQNLTLLIFVVTLFIGLIGSIFLSKRSTDSIRSIVTLLQEHAHPSKEKQDEISLIKTAVGNLLHSNKQIGQNLEEQNRVLNALFVDRILNGDTSFSSVDIENFNESLIKLHNATFLLTVLVLHYEPLEDTPQWDHLSCIKATDLLCDTIAEKLNPLFFCSHLYRSNQLVVILGGDSSPQKQEAFVKHFIQQLLSVLTEPLLSRVAIGVGNSYDCIADICNGYHDAKEAVYYLRKQSMPQVCFWKRDIPITSNTFYYSVDQEKKLINNIKSGNVEDVQIFCDNLYIENFVENQISYTMKTCFLFNLYCTAIKLELPDQLMSNHTHLEFSSLTQRYQQDVDQIFSVLFQRILALALQYHDSKKLTTPEFSDLFKKYIETHYTDSNLDAVQSALAFHFSEGYFSQLFKEHCGETFSNYLEQYRISKACKLLTDPNLTIVAVSEQVGYSNVYTFRRAFKRVLGILPTQYREQI